MKKEFIMTSVMVIGTCIVLLILSGGLDALFDSDPDDTIYSIYMGNGTLNLKNGSSIKLPENIQDDFHNQSFREFEFALKERGIQTYSQLCQYDTLIWSRS
jgi:hypothetical protein